MGQFSWFTQDTGEQIYNDWDIYPNDKQTIHMVDPRDGTDYKEEAYEGYGVFGGVDFYCLIVDINIDFVLNYFIEKPTNEFLNLLHKNNKDLTRDEIDDKRGVGIDLWFRYFETSSSGIPGLNMSEETALNKRLKYNIMSPILVKDYNNWKKYASPEYYPESDPDQGWHTEIENEDEDE